MSALAKSTANFPSMSLHYYCREVAIVEIGAHAHTTNYSEGI